MRKLAIATILIATIAGTALADEITADKIIAAHSLGAPAEKIMEQISNPANTVAPLTAGDMAALRSAGVPETVVQALVTRAPQPTPTPAPLLPDNPKLMELARLVKSGLSVKIIADQLRVNGIDSKPSVNDLIYLQENKIPEVIIVALMEAPLKEQVAAEVQAAAQAAAEEEKIEKAPAEEEISEFPGLVHKTGGFFAKNRAGKLVLENDKLLWRDGSDAGKNFELFINGVKQLTVTCLPGEGGPFCYSVRFDFTKGDDYDFEDSQRDVGGNENLMLLVKTLKERYPNLSVVEKIKK